MRQRRHIASNYDNTWVIVIGWLYQHMDGRDGDWSIYINFFLFSKLTLFNPFVPNAPFLYLLKTCFKGVEKGWIGKE